MKKANTNLSNFIDSDINSIPENTFLKNAIPQLMDDRLKEKYSKILDKEYNIQRKSTSKSSPLMKWILIGISIIIAGIVAFILLQPKEQSSSNPMGQQYAATQKYYEDIDLAQRGEVKSELLVSEMEKAYLNKNSAQVIEAYSQLEESVTLTNVTLYFTAISFAMESDFDNAEKLFSQLLKTQETPFSYHQEARWKLATVLMDQGKQKEAEEILSAIKPNQYKYQDAQILLKK